VAMTPPAFAPRQSLRASWQRLPREARDTLFMLFVIGWTVLPHIGHLPLWCSLLTLVVLLWRAQLATTNAALPGRWVLMAVLLVAAGLTLWSYRTLLGKEPGVTMVVVLMALKTLELRARRDAFVVFFLGFFIVLTHFLYSQSLLVALAMLVSVWGLLTSLVLVHMPVGQPSLRQASALAARTALWGAPIMALMFMLFPRVGPLWGVPKDRPVDHDAHGLGGRDGARRQHRAAHTFRRHRAAAAGHVLPRARAHHLRRRRVASRELRQHCKTARADQPERAR